MPPFVDITLGRVQKPPAPPPQANPQAGAAAAPVRHQRPAHLTNSVYASFRQAIQQGEADLRKGKATAYRRHLRKLGIMDIEELTLLPHDTDDDVFTAVYDTLDTWPQESSFFVLQQLLNGGHDTTPWGQTPPAPLSSAPATRLWLSAQEQAIDQTVLGDHSTESRLWMISRQREFREIRERLEDLLTDLDRL